MQHRHHTKLAQKIIQGLHDQAGDDCGEYKDYFKQRASALTGRPKKAICCVSDIIQTAYVDGYTARPGLYRFLASHHF
jgi:hypothetical protein